MGNVTKRIMKGVITDITFSSVMKEINDFGDNEYKFRKNAEIYEQAQNGVMKVSPKGSDKRDRAKVRLKLLKLYTNFINEYVFRQN